MTKVVSPNGSETHLRAIVFKEGDIYIAQCLEHDICAQATEINAVLERLDLTIDAEFQTCRETGKDPLQICPAPNYYHELWEKRAIQLNRVEMAFPGRHIEVALARAA